MKDLFFDSWGGLWQTCSPGDPYAEAFGPSGSAKRVNAHDFIEFPIGHSAYSTAKKEGRIEEEEWTYLNTLPALSLD